MNFTDNIKYRFATFSIAEKIILINAICFVLPMLLQVIFFLFNMPSTTYMNWLQLSPNLGTFITRPWTIVTYGFFHNGFFHLLWNMVLLFYAGRLLLNLFPDRIFINNYFLGGHCWGDYFYGELCPISCFQGYLSSYDWSISRGYGCIYIHKHLYSRSRDTFFLHQLKIEVFGNGFLFFGCHSNTLRECRWTFGPYRWCGSRFYLCSTVDRREGYRVWISKHLASCFYPKITQNRLQSS